MVATGQKELGSAERLGSGSLRECNSGAGREARAAGRQCASTASMRSATMLVILIIGFTAGPAVSL